MSLFFTFNACNKRTCQACHIYLHASCERGLLERGLSLPIRGATGELAEIAFCIPSLCKLYTKVSLHIDIEAFYFVNKDWGGGDEEQL